MDNASKDVKDLGAEWLRAAQAGDRQARDELVRNLYPIWRRMAEKRMCRERPGHTLQATAVLHEAVSRVLKTNVLARARHVGFLTKIIGIVMDRVLKDHARRKKALRHGGGRRRVPLNQVLDNLVIRSSSAEELQRVLSELGLWDSPGGQALCLQLCGYTVEEIAEELSISVSSVEKRLHFMKKQVRERLKET